MADRDGWQESQENLCCWNAMMMILFTKYLFCQSVSLYTTQGWLECSVVGFPSSRQKNKDKITRSGCSYQKRKSQTCGHKKNKKKTSNPLYCKYFQIPQDQSQQQKNVKEYFQVNQGNIRKGVIVYHDNARPHTT